MLARMSDSRSLEKARGADYWFNVSLNFLEVCSLYFSFLFCLMLHAKPAGGQILILFGSLA